MVKYNIPTKFFFVVLFQHLKLTTKKKGNTPHSSLLSRKTVVAPACSPQNYKLKSLGSSVAVESQKNSRNLYI